MGAYSPVPCATAAIVEVVLDRIVEPTLSALRRAGIDYRGVLYAGLMLTSEGPRLIEYNVRFGDPEAEVVLPRLATDLTDLLAAAAAGSAGSAARPPAGSGSVRFVDDAAVAVVTASGGYPAAPRTGDPIKGWTQPVASRA